MKKYISALPHYLFIFLLAIALSVHANDKAQPASGIELNALANFQNTFANLNAVIAQYKAVGIFSALDEKDVLGFLKSQGVLTDAKLLPAKVINGQYFVGHIYFATRPDGTYQLANGHVIKLSPISSGFENFKKLFTALMLKDTAQIKTPINLLFKYAHAEPAADREDREDRAEAAQAAAALVAHYAEKSLYSLYYAGTAGAALTALQLFHARNSYRSFLSQGTVTCDENAKYVLSDGYSTPEINKLLSSTPPPLDKTTTDHCTQIKDKLYQGEQGCIFTAVAINFAKTAYTVTENLKIVGEDDLNAAGITSGGLCTTRKALIVQNYLKGKYAIANASSAPGATQKQNDNGVAH